MKKAVIIIPTYNERENISKLIPEIFAITSKHKDWDIHILVVDDTSPDGTSQAVETLQKKYPKKLFLLQGKKQGLGKAYIRGFRYVIEHLKPEIIFEMDADGQHDPKLIPHFLKEIDKGADFVIGSRYIKGGSIPEEWELHRKFLSYVGNNLVLRLGFMEFSVTDWTNGFRAIRISFIEKTIGHYENLDGYTFQIGILDQALKHNLVIKEIPCKFLFRQIGSSKIQTFKFIKDNLLYIFTHSSFIKFFIVGLSGAAIDFGIAAFLINHLDMYKPNANAISAEIAIISNFIFNNFWSFQYKKIESNTFSFLLKFAKFNVISSASIFVQWLGMYLAITFIGDMNIHMGFAVIPSWIIYKIFIIALIIIPYSYFMYNHFVWKGSK